MNEDVQRARLLDWEEQVERRLGIVENKVDKLLDPQSGIYPKLSQIESRLSKWAIAILTSVLGSIAIEFIIASRSH